ncbi:MAG: T9SS type A sorting domain-containing protein [Bacteroidota bacterium]
MIHTHRFFLVAFLLFALCGFASAQNYTIVLSGPADNCTSTATCLSITPTGGTNFTWYASVAYPNGPSLATGPVCCPPTTGYFLCVVTDATGQHVTPPVRLRGLNPYITASGNTSSCNTSPVLLQEQVSYVYQMNIFDTYQWYLNGTAIPGANNWNYSATTSGTYTLRVGISCGSAVSNPIPVTIYSPIPSTTTISASGPLTFCSGGSVNLSVPGIASYYQWKLNGVNISGANGPAYTATVSGNYTCAMSNNCNSITTAPVTVNVNPLPNATITASGPLTFCSGGSVQLNASTGTGYAYAWRKDGNPISGANASSYVASSSGSYQVIVTATGCSATSSSSTVTVNPTPVATISAAGPTTFCSGGNVVLNATAGAGYTYSWKKNGSVIAGASTASYTATESGTYTVDVLLGGCTSSSNGITVAVNPLPVVSYSGLSSTYTCQSPPVQLTGNPVGGTFSGPGVSGSQFQPATLAVGGPYSIVYTATNSYGCTGSATQTTSIQSGFNCLIPQNLVVTAVTGTSVSIRWAFSSSSQFQIRYRKTGTTTYTVKTIAATACQNTYTLTGLKRSSTYEIGIRSYCSSTTATAYSNAVTFTTAAARLDERFDNAWSVYPNPVDGFFHLQSPRDLQEETVSVRIFDLTGRLAKGFENVLPNQTTLETDGMSAGTYLLVVFSEEEVVVGNLRLLIR